jgi:hypothetical protein
MKRSPILGIAVAMAMAISACDTTDPMGPLTDDSLDAIIAAASQNTDDNSNPGNDASRGAGGHTLFDDLAEAIPGFGGLYRVSSCHVVVVLTDMTDADAAVAIVQDAVSHLLPRCPNGVRVTGEPGDYTYDELRSFALAAVPLARTGVIAGAWINFQLNRLVVRITPGTEDDVGEALEDAGIPLDAVVFMDADAPARPEGDSSDDSRDDDDSSDDSRDDDDSSGNSRD